MPNSRRRRCWASASRSTTATAKALRGASSTATAMSAGCPTARWQNPARRRPTRSRRLRTFAFPGPSIKLPPVDTLVMGTTLTVVREDGAFAVTRQGWYLPRQHIGGIDAMAADFVAVAERFVGTPYLWGGKSSLGIDCSGLVQVSLNAAGTGCPRDSDMQRDGLGRTSGCGGSQAIAARRPDLLERPCRDRARCRQHRARQRASHGNRDRKHPRRHRAHQGRRQRGYAIKRL